MKRPYLEVTFRNGRPVAAYLYLPRVAGVRSARTAELGPGILVDYAADGTPIGLELTDPAHAAPSAVNEALRSLGVPPLEARELAPLVAA